MNSFFKNKEDRRRKIKEIIERQKRQEEILKKTKENKKNKDFELPKNLLYSYNQEKFWPGNVVEARDTLDSLTYWEEPYFLTSDLEEDQDIKEATKGWNTLELLQSSLFFVLQDWLKITNETGSLFVSSYLWETVFSLSLNPKINLCTLIFVRNLKLFKISTTKEIVDGLLIALKNKNDTLSLLPFEKVLEINALKNLLFLMNFKEGFIDILLKKAYEKKSLNELIDVLEKTPLKINEDFVLRNDLKSFTEIQKDKEKFKQLKDIYEDLVNSKREEMEKFDFFDIFLSDENFKIRTSETLSLLFYQNLFYEISENKKVYLNLFLLFENYVF